MRPIIGSSDAENVLRSPKLLQKIHIGQTKLTGILNLVVKQKSRATLEAVAYVIAANSVKEEACRWSEAQAKDAQAMDW